MIEDASHHLNKLESQSVYILREAFNKINRLAMLWSFGKDSNVMIHLSRKAFFGQVPFSLIHCDTGLEMQEVYDFRDRYTGEWGIDLISHPCPPLEATDPTLPYAARVAARKTLGLKEVVQKYDFTGIIAGIRRDEEGTRAKERCFSPRCADGLWDAKIQPPEFWDQYASDLAPGVSVRIHPLLHWGEADIWHYIKREAIPVVPLYFARKWDDCYGKNFGGEMMRFRSLGEKGITFPVKSTASSLDEIIEELRTTRVSERSGRPMGADEDESSFERLRQAGYM